MKIKITQNLVDRLTIDRRPVDGLPPDKWPANPDQKPYVITDATGGLRGKNGSSPPGFGIKMTSGAKRYILQHRVKTSGAGQVVRLTIGPIESITISEARAAAWAKLAIVEATGQQPSVVMKEREARDLTLGEILDAYRHELVSRKHPAKPNTIKSLDKAAKKLSNWKDRRISSLTDDDILKRFTEIARVHPTTAEQTFRWATTATTYALKEERRWAQRARTTPIMTFNPFEVLTDKQMFRRRSELEKHYEATGARTPLALGGTLGYWLKAVTGRRRENRTGCDFLLVTVLLGGRRSEAACLRWRHMLTDAEAKKSSYVDMEEGIVLFRDTKNGLDHRLPMCLAVRRILSDRLVMAEEQIAQDLLSRDDRHDPTRNTWVFPPRSNSPLRKVPHYSNPNTLMRYICQDVGLYRWKVRVRPDGTRYQVRQANVQMHDLRRTFAAITDQLQLPTSTTKIFLNHFEEYVLPFIDEPKPLPDIEVVNEDEHSAVNDYETEAETEA